MILRAINSTLDYCLFTLGFVLAVQLPEFIQQYKQYIAGKVSESEWHLNSYQAIADRSYNGDINLLINEYLNSEQLAIRETGQFVSELKQRYETLTQFVTELNSNNYFDQLIEFFKQINIEDAQTVISYYQLAIPLTIDAIGSGVVLAFIFVWLKILFVSLLSKLLPINSHRKAI